MKQAYRLSYNQLEKWLETFHQLGLSEFNKDAYKAYFIQLSRDMGVIPKNLPSEQYELYKGLMLANFNYIEILYLTSSDTLVKGC